MLQRISNGETSSSMATRASLKIIFSLGVVTVTLVFFMMAQNGNNTGDIGMRSSNTPARASTFATNSIPLTTNHTVNNTTENKPSSKRKTTNSVVNGVHCNKRTKDIYLRSGYPYSQFNHKTVLETLESVNFEKPTYFNMLRNMSGGHPYNDLETNEMRSYEIKAMGEGVQLFIPQTVSPDPRVQRRFLCFGDSIVRETCNALGVFTADAKVHSNGKMKDIKRPHLPHSEISINMGIKFYDQLKKVYKEQGTSILFRWDPLFNGAGKYSKEIAHFHRKYEKHQNAHNTRTTIILGFGMHGLFRHVDPSELSINSRMEKVKNSLILYFNQLKQLVPKHSIDVVWIGSGVNDRDVLHGLPRFEPYYYDFFDHYKMERLPVLERPLLQSLQRRFPELTIHHVPRALHDRKYPGVRCDGMHFARSSLKEACSGVAEVLVSFVNIILNVVESGGVMHQPDEFLPFAACPTLLYDLHNADKW